MASISYEAKPKEPDSVTLVLTADEAVMLHLVLSCVGGDPNYTWRRVADDVYKKLNTLIVRQHDYREVFREGTIYAQCLGLPKVQWQL